jgi:2-dehydropantoate 2-reductase
MGCGAIGSIVAAHLTLAGVPVTVVDPWFRHVEEVRAAGVRITAPDEEHRVRLAAVNVDEMHEVDRPVDVLLVAVKAYDSAAAIGLLRPLLHEGSVVVPVQNGMTAQWFCRLVGDSRVVGCAVHVPAELTGAGNVVRYLPRDRRTFTLGEVAGPVTPRVRQLAELLAPAGLTDVTDDLPAVKWGKLAVNAMTNAPAGLTGWTTHRLWSDPAVAGLAVRAAGETVAVAEAAGVAPAPLFGRLDPTLFRTALHDRGAAREAAASLAVEAQGRTGPSESRPSLLQDVDRGRRTEVRYLNGHVAAEGAACGVPTPVNTAMLELVEQVDRGVLRKDPENLGRLGELVDRGAG